MTELVRIADHAAEGEALLIEQFKNAVNLKSFIGTFMSRVQEIEDMLIALLPARWIENATGLQLDGLGAIVGVAREQAADELYRKRILVRIRINLADGTADQMLEIVKLLVPSDATIILREYFPASIVVDVSSPISDIAEEVARCISQSKATGVRAQLIYSFEGPTTDFLFADSTFVDNSSANGFAGVNQAGTFWYERTVTGFSATDDIFAVAIDGTAMVAVGENGKISVSTDKGATWTACVDPASGGSNWRWVVSRGGVFVAGGSGGHIIKSSDGGFTWTLSTTLTTGDAHYGAAGGVRFVVCGLSGKIHSSNDGVTWTLHHDLGGVNANTIEYLNGMFLCAGASSTLATSPDGITWTDQTSNLSGTAQCLGYDSSNGLWLVAGSAGKLASSPDGTTWTAQTTGLSGEIRRIATDGTITVIAGVNASSKNLAYSTDSVSWTALQVAGATDLNGVYWALGIFEVAAGGGLLYSSPDAATWTAGITSGNGFGFTSAFAHSAGLIAGPDAYFAFGSNRRFVSGENTGSGGGQFASLLEA